MDLEALMDLAGLAVYSFNKQLDHGKLKSDRLTADKSVKAWTGLIKLESACACVWLEVSIYLTIGVNSELSR